MERGGGGAYRQRLWGGEVTARRGLHPSCIGFPEAMPSRFEKYSTHHTSRRTDGWDYTQPAAYFVTICTTDRRCLFGTVRRGRMHLNPLGQIVAE